MLASLLLSQLLFFQNPGKPPPGTAPKPSFPGNGGVIPTRPINPKNPPGTPPKPAPPGVMSNGYKAALQKSGELGKPVFVLYCAEWCGYCKKLKAETLPDGKVVQVLKNYIVVYVDPDKDRSGMDKFGVRGFPSFVVTNVKEEKLKMGEGFMKADPFFKWLNDPTLFNQPKVK